MVGNVYREEQQNNYPGGEQGGYRSSCPSGHRYRGYGKRGIPLRLNRKLRRGVRKINFFNKKWRRIFLLLTGICICMNEMKNIEKTAQVSMSSMIRMEAADRITPFLFPIFSFLSADSYESSFAQLLEQRVGRAVPIYDYGTRDVFQVAEESRLDYDQIIRQEGSDEYTGELSDDIMLEDSMEEALIQENKESLNSQVAEENERVRTQSGFVRSTEKSRQYSRDSMEDEEWVRKNFYAVDATTEARPGVLTAAQFLEEDMRVEKGGEEPRILIYHTHSQETYVDSAPGDPSQSVVGVGERLAGILREEYGYNVLHHTGEYDVERRDYAYSKAAPALEKLLADHPGIEVIIDLHRDSVPEDRKLVIDMNGRPTAMVMFFNGLSYTKQTGPIDYLENANLSGNLAFAFKMQLACNEYYPGLTRKIYLKGYRYNMQYKPKTLLIELGAQTNTVEEAMNACDPLAHALSMVFEGEY